MATESFEDLRLEIKGEQGKYLVRVVVSPAIQEVEETVLLDIESFDKQLTKMWDAISAYSTKFRSLRPSENQTGRSGQEPSTIVKEIGADLFNRFIVGTVKDTYSASMRRANDQDKGLRLKLQILAPELKALPWEYLYDTTNNRHFCFCAKTSIVRYPPRIFDPDRIPLRLPLRILGMVATPQGLPKLDIGSEMQRLEHALAEFKGYIELEWVEGQTWDNLQKKLERGPWHVFHFIGHGKYDGQGKIAFADPNGEPILYSDEDLCDLLCRYRRDTRIVVLNCCESATCDFNRASPSIAEKLTESVVPAVVAMQHEIIDDAAIVFAVKFYESIVLNKSIDDAVLSGRLAIRYHRDWSLHWGIPVLYAHMPDGRIFGAVVPPGADILSNLIQRPEVIKSMGKLEQGLQAVSAEIDAMRDYKVLHDDLLELITYHHLIALEGDCFTTDPNSIKRLSGHKQQLDRIVNQLKSVLQKRVPRGDLSWANYAVGLRDGLDQALTGSSGEALAAAMKPLPSPFFKNIGIINNLLVERARNLDLESIKQKLREICDTVGDSQIPSLRPLYEGINRFSALSDRLAILREEHSRWQQAVDGLNSLSNASDPDIIRNICSVVQGEVEQLCPRMPEENVKELHKVGTQLNDMLKNSPDVDRNVIQEYHRAVLLALFIADEKLKKFCFEELTSEEEHLSTFMETISNLLVGGNET